MDWRNRRAFLLGLTGAAGALDALVFLLLGKVFTSFQSGNVLFLGLAVGRGDWALAVRAGVVLAAFVLGAAGGAYLIGARLNPKGVALEVRVVALEAVALAVFGALWIALGTPDGQGVARIVLLAIAAGTMGVQASLSLALKVPNVMTVALTGTVANVGQRLGLAAAGGDGSGTDRQTATLGLEVTLVVAYALCALGVAAARDTTWIALAPTVLLVAGLALDVRRTAPRGARGDGRQRRREVATMSASAADSSRSSAAQ